MATFTVYCDTPTDVSPAPKAKRAPGTVLVASDPNASAVTPALSPVIEKENINPLTGEPCVPPSMSKKRKTSQVLATKDVLTKKHKEDKVEGKKIRSKKDSGKSSRKASSKKPRRVPTLPKLDEEDGAARERLMHADIASRCYELTVVPLADVTEAYDAAFGSDAPPTSEERAKFRKATSAEPEIRDYFSSSHSSGSLARVTPPASSAGQDPVVFSTPERRHIYSAFTFTTPSPSAERFRQVSRSPSPRVPALKLRSPSPVAST
ncbi:unnamed protein product [Mycena citricolor]|uniref:Uncharacterized protein n=1 Tax=Mycena citricolor TaxID=2018698 RepID=A0AAD2HGL3_9AGAR|nr:unnamed protein product [Mycena citricolor]